MICNIKRTNLSLVQKKPAKDCPLSVLDVPHQQRTSLRQDLRVVFEIDTSEKKKDDKKSAPRVEKRTKKR